MRRASGKLWISIVLCCCSLQLTAAAQQRKAQTPVANYDDLVARGVKAFETGDYAQARQLFEHAHRINPNARSLRGMGLAAFQAKRYAVAGLDFERALADTRQPLDDAQRDELERLQGAANAATARFRLKGQQPGAVILIDGEPPLIDAGGFVLMDAGTHTIKLQLAGGEQRSMLVNAAGGEWSELDVSATQSENPWEQVPAPAKPPVVVNVSELPPPAAAAPPVPFEAVPVAGAEPVADDAAHEGNTLKSAIVPAMFGGAAIAAGFSIWQWRVREDEVDAWNSDECLQNGQTRLENCGAHQSAYQTAQTWAWISAGTAIALSAGAVVWLLLDQPAKAAEQAAADGCVPGGLAVSCRVKF